MCLNKLKILLISKRDRERDKARKTEKRESASYQFIPEAQLAFHELAYTLNGAFHQNDQLNGDH